MMQKQMPPPKKKQQKKINDLFKSKTMVKR